MPIDDQPIMTTWGCGSDQADQLERRTLITLLLINGVMFVVEVGWGWIAESTSLIADSLDMLADAAVYGLSLAAVGMGRKQQARAARFSGLLQIMLGTGVLLDVSRRFVFGSAPESLLIIRVGAVALVANLVCLMLLSRHRRSGVHMRASWIFSTNDVIANLGVIASGVLVWILGTRLPDLLVGTAIAIVIVRGGIRILSEVEHQHQAHPGP